MGLLDWIRSTLLGGGHNRSGSLSVYVKIPEPLGPRERAERYDNELGSALTRTGLGTIAAARSHVGGELPDGTPTVQGCGIEVDVVHLAQGLALLRTELQTLGVPVGTELHYSMDGERLQDEMHPRGWVLRKPRSPVRPGAR
jgi:hypothetical protein